MLPSDLTPRKEQRNWWGLSQGSVETYYQPLPLIFDGFACAAVWMAHTHSGVKGTALDARTTDK